MIAWLLAQASLPQLGALPVQALPAQGCAAYLWSAADRRLVAMASADPARLRLWVGGRMLDLPRGEARGVGGYGLPAISVFRDGDVTARLDLTVSDRSGLADGASVPQATLGIEQVGHDALVVPLAGLIGCAKAVTDRR